MLLMVSVTLYSILEFFRGQKLFFPVGATFSIGALYVLVVAYFVMEELG